MTALKLICPTCRTVLGKIHVSESGTEYGCEKCGKWLTTRELAKLGVPMDDPAKVVSGIRLAVPPSLLDLTKISIVLELTSASLADAVKVLVPKALHGTGEAFLRNAEIIKALCEGISDGSCVESHRGAALIHLRMGNLPASRTAIGISAEGMTPGDGAQDRVYVVVLFLKPKREVGADVPPWARKKFGDEKTIYKLRRASDLEAVFKVLQTA